MFLSDTNVTINIRHDDAVIINRHVPLGRRKDITPNDLAIHLHQLGLEPLCPHISVNDISIGAIGHHDDPNSFKYLVKPNPRFYIPARGVTWNGMYQCRKCPMMFWFLDAWNRCRGPAHEHRNAVSLEVYRAFPSFTRKADLNYTAMEDDGPGVGWLQYFKWEEPLEGFIDEGFIYMEEET